jgi:hypothetical protein
MSKKKFSAGLDDLFKHDDGGEHHAELFSASSPHPPAERRQTGKNFMAGLDALLQEALEESLDKLENNRPSEATPPTKSKSKSAASSSMFGGLDALIRQTIDVQDLHTDEQTGIKRLTVAVEKAKLEKLKAIARLENAYMKDLLVALIDEYIAEYTKDKGIDL